MKSKPLSYQARKILKSKEIIEEDFCTIHYEDIAQLEDNTPACTTCAAEMSNKTHLKFLKGLIDKKPKPEPRIRKGIRLR